MWKHFKDIVDCKIKISWECDVVAQRQLKKYIVVQSLVLSKINNNFPYR